MRPASQRALVWVVSIAAVLAPAAGLAYLGAVSYRDDRGALAKRLEEQNRRAAEIARRIEERLRGAVDAVAAADGADELTAIERGALGAEPFVVDRGDLVWPPEAALGDASGDLFARSDPCSSRGLESCLREIRTQERRARELDDARRAELLACPDGACRIGDALATARRLYADLARHGDTAPAALLGLARLARGAGDRDAARAHLTRLLSRYGERTQRGLPYELVARLALGELDPGAGPLLELYADLLDREIVAPAEVLDAAVDRVAAALADKPLDAEQAATRAVLDARLARARHLEARAAALAPEVPELAREAGESMRARALRRNPERTVAFRAIGPTIVGVTVDNARLEASAGPDAAADIADGARVAILPVGTSPPADLRTVAAAPLGPSVPHLTLAIVNDRRRPDPLDGVIRERSRRHLVLTGGLAALLAIGLLATIRAAARERELARLQSHFVSTVSHELKTPLTSIRMFAEMLREGVAGDDAQRQGRYHDIIVKESQRLGLLIANLLDYAQIERGTRRYSQGRERVAAVAGAAVDTFLQLQDPTAGNEVRLTVSPEAAAAEAVVDREVLVGAVLNLLSNAAKYGGGARAIEVDVARRGAEVTITVTDHGPGVPPVEQSRIFREFYRAPAAYSSGAPGTGLGLALVKRHVEALGGTVSVTSDLGRGAAFTIALPIAEGATA